MQKELLLLEMVAKPSLSIPFVLTETNVKVNSLMAMKKMLRLRTESVQESQPEKVFSLKLTD